MLGVKVMGTGNWTCNLVEIWKCYGRDKCVKK